MKLLLRGRYLPATVGGPTYAIANYVERAPVVGVKSDVFTIAACSRAFRGIVAARVAARIL